MKKKKPRLTKTISANLQATLVLGILLPIPSREADTMAGDYDYIFSYVIDKAESNADAKDVRITA